MAQAGVHAGCGSGSPRSGRPASSRQAKKLLGMSPSSCRCTLLKARCWNWCCTTMTTSAQTMSWEGTFRQADIAQQLLATPCKSQSTLLSLPVPPNKPHCIVSYGISFSLHHCCYHYHMSLNLQYINTRFIVSHTLCYMPCAVDAAVLQ